MICDISVLCQLSEHRREILSARHQNHCGDDEWLEARFAIGRNTVFFEDSRRDLALRATHPRNVRWQTMQVERFPAAREPHFRLIAFPTFEPRIIDQAFL